MEWAYSLETKGKEETPADGRGRERARERQYLTADDALWHGHGLRAKSGG